LDINVTGAFGGARGIDHVDGGLVVFVEDGRSSLGKTKFVWDGTKVLGNFGGTDGSNELSFGGAGGDSGLELGFVGDGSTGEAETEAGDRAASARTSDMGSIDKAGEFKRREVGRETWKRWVRGKGSVGTRFRGTCFYTLSPVKRVSAHCCNSWLTGGDPQLAAFRGPTLTTLQSS
jgi:hypothetical protein